MSDIAIKVEGLSKLYRLGQITGYKTVQEALAVAVAGIFRRFSGPRGATQSAGDPNRLPLSTERPSYIWALKGISFEVRRGEAVAIIGGNGAGKSTLLKILSRITAPTAGYAEIHGRIGSLLEVGTGFHPELTGKENIYFSGAVLGMKRAEIDRVFDQIVDFAGVENFLDTPVKRYSSGMYVRLGFAVAAHLEPDVLIVDEVLAVGDAAFQRKCMGKMNDVTREGRTVLFVSHNMSAVRALCPRAILLEQGVMKADGDTSQVVQSYLGINSDMLTRIVWPAGQRPGNHSFKLNSVALRNPDGSLSKSIEISRGGLIEIDFEIIEDGAQAGFSLVLFDSGGVCIFSSLSNAEQNYHGKSLACGRYVTTCRLPGDLLNSGTYSISVIGFSAHWSDQFRVDSVFSFLANDDGVLRQDYHGGYGGLLRPRLEWHTHRLENQ